jgi:hypothetical protein
VLIVRTQDRPNRLKFYPFVECNIHRHLQAGGAVFMLCRNNSCRMQECGVGCGTTTCQRKNQQELEKTSKRGMAQVAEIARLYVGWLLTFWVAPTMTTAHLVFALATTPYILIAIRWEERDLIDAHSVMARPAFKRCWTRLVPNRSTIQGKSMGPG